MGNTPNNAFFTEGAVWASTFTGAGSKKNNKKNCPAREAAPLMLAYYTREAGFHSGLIASIIPLCIREHFSCHFKEDSPCFAPNLQLA